jgi:hypothetical protein
MKTFIKHFWLAALVLGGVVSSRASVQPWNAASGQIIPDNNPSSGAASDIYISSGDSQLTGIVNPLVASVDNVTFTIAGGWAGDYTVVLKYTDGVNSLSSTLFSSLQGGAAANGGFTGVVLTTGTGSAITSAGSTSSTAAITGTFSGVDFSAFQGLAPMGDWILYVTDNQGGDQGILTGWSLSLNVVPEPVNVALAVFGGLTGVVAWARHRKKPKS